MQAESDISVTHFVTTWLLLFSVTDIPSNFKVASVTEREPSELPYPARLHFIFGVSWATGIKPPFKCPTQVHSRLQEKSTIVSRPGLFTFSRFFASLSAIAT